MAVAAACDPQISPGGPFDLIIFDLDGTLVDSVVDIAWALNETLREAAHDTFGLAEVRKMVGDGATELIARAAPPDTTPRDRATLVSRFMAHYRDHLVVGSRLYPGIPDLLESQLRSGATLAVLTNKPGELARGVLAQLKILDKFGEVIGDGDGFPRKPDPAAAHHLVAGAPNPSSARVVVVGDGLPDLRLAHAIPCPSIGVTWGYTAEEPLRAESPTFIAHSVRELKEFLGGP